MPKDLKLSYPNANSARDALRTYCNVPPLPRHEWMNTEIHTLIDDTLLDIYGAFGGVSRQGGVSWSQAEAIDYYRSAAGDPWYSPFDTDSSWNDLLSMPEYFFPCGVGGFHFLDEIGYVYYLPAAMVFGLRESEDAFDLEFKFNVTPEGQITPEDLPPLTAHQWIAVHKYFRTLCSVFEHRWGEEDEMLLKTISALPKTF